MKTTSRELSHSDKQILNKINDIDSKWGWLRWLDIVVLAEQLSDESMKNYWISKCNRYNHIEEYYSGCQ